MGYGTTKVSNVAEMPVESASKIRDVVSSHEQQMSELHATVDELEKRLDTVLTPSPLTTGAEIANQPTPPSSNLHQRAVEHGRGLTYMIQRLRDISRRIEV